MLCNIWSFNLSYQAIEWTLFEEQMLSIKVAFCVQDAPHIPPPSNSL